MTKTPATTPMPIARNTSIAPSTLTPLVSARQPALESREIRWIGGPVRRVREVGRRRRAVDEAREVRAGRAGELRCIAEARRDVGGVVHRVRVVGLAEEGLRHPAHL